MVKFSIIVPFYKGNRFLKTLFHIAIENAKSVRKVISDGEVELIIVNDSPSEQIVIPAEAEMIPFKILTHSVNQGIHQARVTGLQESDGDYVVFLDQDDEITEDFLADQYRKIGDADVIIACAFLEKEDGTLVDLYDSPGKKRKLLNIDTYIKSHNQIASPGQCLIKRTAIPKEWTDHIMTINGSDDLFLWILMFDGGSVVVLNDRCLYTHKYTGENLSDSIYKMAKSSEEFSGFLQEISYVSEKHKQSLKTSIKYDTERSTATGLKKMMIAAKYPQLIMHKIIWKIKCL